MSASQFVDLPPSRIDQFLTPGVNPESPITTTTFTQPKPTNQTEIKEQQAIPSFFTKKRKTDEDELISSGVDVTPDTQLTFCSKCGRKLPVSEAQEHEGYHYALDVQQQMNMGRCGLVKGLTGCGVGSRRKRFGSDIADFFK